MSSIYEVRRMYRKLKFRTNKVCKECQPKHKNPLSIWHVGSKFAKDKHKILFVGKTGRGPWGKRNKSGYVCETRNEVNERFFKCTNAYWGYTRKILSIIYGTPENGWDRIAFSNIIKCTDTKTEDKTKKSVKNNCILKLCVIQKEIKILKPKNVIFFTGKKYDEQIDNLFDKLKVFFKAQKVVTLKKILPSGKGNSLKYDQKALLDKRGKWIMRFLITSHPERQKKDRFIRNLVRWIRNGDDNRANKRIKK